ncbi:MAG: FtsX-like permease family protein [Oscillospiraceae bacterium]|nr:FtsX-like permease family protein [Oscillospiraceae bacterium]
MLFRKLLRTAWSYKAQFISMIIMMTLGIGIFLGFNMEWKTIEYDVGNFFEETKYADYRLYSETGFAKDELEAIASIDGVDAATRYLSVNLELKGDSKKALALDVSENYTVSTITLMEGAEYDETSDGIWLSDKFAKLNGISLGDTLTLEFQGMEIDGEVVGLIKAGEHMICLADSNQVMPDFNTFGYAYISPAKLNAILREKALNTIADELQKAGVPADMVREQAEAMLTDEVMREATDKAFPQINLRSDLEKTELEDAIKEKLGKTLMVVAKEDHTVYKEAMGEATEGKAMGSILPVLFLAIAILTMVTTMHRIATKEKTQIGVLKALGFKNRTVLLHYSLYGLFIGIAGAVLGGVLGYFVCKAVMSENGMMGTYFDMPDWSAATPAFCYPVIAGTVILLALISFLSVRSQLRGTAADALRPYTPKKMKKSFLEKLPLFGKMSFATKWNVRDLMRHKSRFAMTLVGIIGCMILLVGGLGMRDTMAGFLDLLDNGVSHYATKVNLVENTEYENAKQLIADLDGDWESFSGISFGGDTVTLDIVHNDKGRFSVIDENNHEIALRDDGVYLCLRLADRAKIGDSIAFSPYGGEETYRVKVVGYNRSIMTENVTMTDKYADALGIDYSISAIYTDQDSGEIPSSELISGKQDKQQLMDSFSSFVEIMDGMVFILIIAAVVLGIVVLYNLGVMSYVERSRELATLKVLGFRSKKIGQLLISQNIWLTVVGVLLGLPAGLGTLYWMLTALAGEYEMKLMLGPLTYSVSILLTFGVSLLVGWMVARKNKKIDMVEALKNAE